MQKSLLFVLVLLMACKDKPKINTGPFKAGDTVTVSIKRDSMGTTAILTTPRIVMTDRNHGPAELIDGSDTVKTFLKYSGNLYISGDGTTGRPIGLGKRKIDSGFSSSPLAYNYDTLPFPRIILTKSEVYLIVSDNGREIAQRDTLGVWHVKDIQSTLNILAGQVNRLDSLYWTLYRQNDSLKNLLHR